MAVPVLGGEAVGVVQGSVRVCGKGGTLGETVGYLIALHVCMARNPQEEDCGQQ